MGVEGNLNEKDISKFIKYVKDKVIMIKFNIKKA